MALIEYDSYKQKLRELGPELEKLAAALDIESAKQEAARLARLESAEEEKPPPPAEEPENSTPLHRLLSFIKGKR